jgi:hypothetical protein
MKGASADNVNVRSSFEMIRAASNQVGGGAADRLVQDFSRLQAPSAAQQGGGRSSGGVASNQYSRGPAAGVPGSARGGPAAPGGLLRRSVQEVNVR